MTLVFAMRPLSRDGTVSCVARPVARSSLRFAKDNVLIGNYHMVSRERIGLSPKCGVTKSHVCETCYESQKPSDVMEL